MSEKQWKHWIRKRVQGAAPVLWILEERLACSPRPLRYRGPFRGRIPVLPPEAHGPLVEWLASLRELGIGTITCLATLGELRRYSPALAGAANLLALYSSSGFRVHHHPVEDPHHAPEEARGGILEQLEQLKPVVYDEYLSRTGAFLIHCSGGMDRASPVAAYIAALKRPSGP